MSKPVLGLLHTAPSHRVRFGALLRELARDVAWVDRVREDLLRAAMEGVPEADLSTEIGAALDDLRADGAEQVLCTCSSIGGLAEIVGAGRQLPTLRVDRPMAERAITTGRQVLVVACLPSTVAPTSALLRGCAAQAGREIEIETLLLPAAWRQFEAGDEAGFHRAIADALREASPRADVIVLAQASMARAADLLGGFPVPVLSSPRLGVEAALARLTTQRGHARAMN